MINTADYDVNISIWHDVSSDLVSDYARFFGVGLDTEPPITK